MGRIWDALMSIFGSEDDFRKGARKYHLDNPDDSNSMLDIDETSKQKKMVTKPYIDKGKRGEK